MKAMNIMKRTAVVALLGGLGAVPMGVSAQSSESSATTTCIENCFDLATSQMQQQTTSTTHQPTAEGTVTTIVQQPSNAPTSVYNAAGTCVANCMKTVSGQ